MTEMFFILRYGDDIHLKDLKNVRVIQKYFLNILAYNYEGPGKYST